MKSRKVLLINPRFQLTCLGFSASLALLSLSIVFFANAYFFWKFKGLGATSGLSQDHVFFRFLQEQQSQMNGIFLATAVLVFGVLLLGGLLLSHRVAGPLYHLEQHCRRLAQGERAGELRFREKDFFQEIPPVFNAAVASTRGGAGAPPSAMKTPPPFRGKLSA